MMISPETLIGLVSQLVMMLHTLEVMFYLSVLSFTELVPYLFSIDGVKVFLSEHLCQDPLESFF